MKKASKVAVKRNRNFSQQTLTIGLDLGDRNSCYCVLDEAGQIQLSELGHEVIVAFPQTQVSRRKNIFRTVEE